MLTASESLIQFESVSKRYRRREGETLKEFLAELVKRNKISSIFYALRDVSFHVKQGETLGIIGRNGSGKTTILKLIARVTAPTAGRVDVSGRISPLLELGAGFHPDLTGRENVFLNASILGMDRASILEHYDEIVAFAELADFMETPVKRYSSGMYVRLAFAVAAHSSPDIFLIDESLSVGDAAFREKCMARMEDFRASGGTIVFVSHDLQTVVDFCDRALLLADGQILFDGPPADAVECYETSVGIHV